MTRIVEIFPHGTKKELYKKSIDTEKIHTTLDAIQFTQQQQFNLLTNKDCKSITSTILQKIINITDSEYAFLGTVSQETNSLNYFDVVGVPHPISGLHISLETGSLLSYPITKGCILISNDTKTDPRAMKKNVQLLKHPEIKTFAGIPLFLDSQIVGLLGIANRTRYGKSTIEKILPYVEFCSTFVHLWSSDLLIKPTTNDELISIKDSFVATMSHEIRTPLNGIVNMAKLLSEGTNLTEKQEQYIKILTQCSTQLMELVNDILDYSKMSRGSLTLNKQPFNLINLINSSVDIVRQSAVIKGLELHTYIPTIPENVTGDARRLKQVLLNILNNAIKFTAAGQIDFSVEYQNTEISKNYKKFIFKIKDTGVGIRKEDQQKIFEVFTKVQKDDQFYTNISPGVGLGLTISQHIIEAMQGTISVESDGCHGSTFVFSVCLEDESDISKLLELHETEIKNKIAIVVDDKEDNRIFLMETLHSWGIQVHSFGSAREALNHMAFGGTFDVALVDLAMPAMNGIQLVQTMRERKYTQQVIGLSSIGSELAGKEWFDYFVTKPISKSYLFNLLLRCFLNDSFSSVVSEINDFNPDDFRILIAEDDYFNQIVLQELLGNLGYTDITIVSNGKLCVDRIKHNRYDVCLMDIKMPVMDGLEATKKIKKYPNAPVVIGVSASVLDTDRAKCSAVGMDGYLTKPIQKEQLASVLQILQQRVEVVKNVKNIADQ